MSGQGIIRVQKQLLVIEMIANDVMLNDTEKIEQINEAINQYYEQIKYIKKEHYQKLKQLLEVIVVIFLNKK